MNYGTTIGEALKKYLRFVNKYELYDRDIIFLYNAQKIDISNTIKVGEFFEWIVCPKIIVNEMGNLIGA